ncbi:MAG: hypothetical protein U1A78_41725 [Polyangia bacterium]
MPRRLLAHQGFPGKDFQKEIRALQPKQRRQAEEVINKLFDDLISFKSDIFRDTCMRGWKPQVYHRVPAVASEAIVELTCNRTMRVIVAYSAKSDRVILLAATYSHDHARLTRQVHTAVRSLASEEPPVDVGDLRSAEADVGHGQAEGNPGN